jgi:hypothetical protein
MTEPEDPRVDLRALDEPPDPQRVDRVMRAVMARVAASPRPHASRVQTGVWDDLAAWMRPGLAAAAVLAALAGGTLAVHAGSRRGADSLAVGPDTVTAVASTDVEARVAEWLVARRAPTAGELLAAFRGYPQ